MRRRAAAALALLLAATPAAATPDGFHPPASPAERALDAILKLADAEPDFGDFALDRPRRRTRQDARFAALVSDPLRAAWRRAEVEAVRRNCKGRYVAGESCGLDIHPVTCAQDSADAYVYRTLADAPERVVIAYGWPDQPAPLARYRLVRRDGAWRLDGVACGSAERFNMSDDAR